MMVKKKRIVIFDFDGTLTRGDTFLQFPLHAFGWGRTLLTLLRGVPAVARWKLGRITSSEAKERLTALFYGGKSKRVMMAKGESFEPEWRTPILEKLRGYMAQGDDVWIVSASPDIWLAPIAARLGVKLLCTETATDSSGRLTGRFSTPNCHGAEKVRRLYEALPELAHESEDREIIVYGDEPSGGDAALFAIATTANYVAGHHAKVVSRHSHN